MGAGPDAVYQVTLSSPATLTAQVTATGFTPRISIRSTCSTTSTLACDSVPVSGVATATTSQLAAGTYFVWVDSSQPAAAGSYSLSLTASRGPSDGGLTTFNIVVMNQSVTVDQYVPAGPGPFPVIALGHGFSLGKSSMGTLATTLRDDGFVVVVPQFPTVSTNSTLHSQMMLASVDWVVDAGIANPNALGLGGHSAGALSAWLAAAQRQTQTRAVVLLDPLDDTSLGAAQAANVLAPTVWVFAPPSMSCNSNNNSAPWFTPKPGRKTRLNVVGATACDPADPVPASCGLTCGAPAPNRAAVFRRYARAHFGRELLGPTLFPCVDPMVLGDVDAGIVNGAVTSLGCP